MASGLINLDDLISGPLLSKACGLPLSFRAVIGDLHARMIDKGRVGGGYRAIARNGRILLASDQPLDRLAGLIARVRIQIWNRVILQGEAPELYGLLLHIRAKPTRISVNLLSEEPLCALQLEPYHRKGHDLTLEVGGGMVLVVCRSEPEA